MGVSKNRGTPKSSILIGFSIINHPFWGTPIFGNTHVTFVTYLFCVTHSTGDPMLGSTNPNLRGLGWRCTSHLVAVQKDSMFFSRVFNMFNLHLIILSSYHLIYSSPSFSSESFIIEPNRIIRNLHRCRHHHHHLDHLPMLSNQNSHC